MVILGLLAGIAAAPVSYYLPIVIDRGPYKLAEVYGVSGDGSTLVGTGSLEDGVHSYEALVWKNGHPVSLHPKGYLYSFCYATNLNGSVQVGSATPNTSLDETEPSVWHGTAGSRLNVMPPSLGHPAYAEITAVSDDGTIFGGDGCHNDGDSDGPIIWKGTPPLGTRVGILSTAQSGQYTPLGSLSMSADGRAYGSWFPVGDVGWDAITWRSPDQAVPLFWTGWTTIGALSNDGVLVGTGWTPTGDHMLVWRSGKAGDIHPKGYQYSYPTAISRDGLYAVGGAFNLVNGNYSTDGVLWDLSSGQSTILSAGLSPAFFRSSDSYRDCEVRGIDRAGDVVGWAHNFQLGDCPIVWKKVSGPAVVFQPAPVFRKNPVTKRCEIDVPMSVAAVNPGATVEVTVTDPHGGLSLHANSPVAQAGVSFKEVTFDLAQLGVPRFVHPMNPIVSIQLHDGVVNGPIIQQSIPTIKLPVIVIRGLIASDTPWADPVFQSAMIAYGYETATAPPSYPTLFFPVYDPDDQTLDKNVFNVAANLNAELAQTYAGKADFVCHSKGCLVFRRLLAARLLKPATVRRAILCCGPHTGSVLAGVDLNLQIIVTTEVANELTPTFPWFRNDPSQDFQELPINTSLAALNNNPMPLGLEYYLFAGQTKATLTPVNLTKKSLVIGLNLGDLVVPMPDELGYELINHKDGTTSLGKGISAFYGSAAQHPAGLYALPYGHLSFLGQAVDRIVAILRKS